MKLNSSNILPFLVFFVLLVNEAYSLECYVCTNQSDNEHKCLKTIKTCEQYEDVCLTEVRWGTTPYWSQGAEKQYYVSKMCSTKDHCEKLRNRYMPYCTHIWYQDWKCSDCCRGDRCNYYIILSGSIARSSITVIFIGIFSILFLNKILI